MKTSSYATLALLASLALAPSLTACTDADAIDDGTTSEEIGARGRFDLWKDGGAHVFQFVSAQGETLVDSQDYTSRTAALGGLVSVLDNGINAARYTVTVAADGRAHFELHSANGQVIGTSQTYATKAGATTAVKAAVAGLKAYPRHWTGGTGARFEIRADAGGKYFFALHAANGSIVLRSERYETLAAALNGAFSVTDNGTSSARYAMVDAANGGVYFNLTAVNGQVIATSEVYSSKSNALRARDAIIALLPAVSIL
jgi:uncharacterized protein YegP (UPF0339 family)